MMNWILTFHIVLVASWFAGLFYLPRIYVNLAMEKNPAAYHRLLIMAQKLFRFMTIIAVPAILLGEWLYHGYDLGKGQYWIHIKVIFVFLAILYHFYCYRLLKVFEAHKNVHSDKWYRVFNEIPVVLMIVIVGLVVMKPF